MNFEKLTELHAKWDRTGMLYGLPDSVSEVCCAYNLEYGARYLQKLARGQSLSGLKNDADDDFYGFFLGYVRRLQDEYPHSRFNWTELGPLLYQAYISLVPKIIKKRASLLKNKKEGEYYIEGDADYEIVKDSFHPGINFKEFEIPDSED